MLRRTPIKKFSDKKLAQLKAQGITNPTSTFTGPRKPLPKSQKPLRKISKKEKSLRDDMHKSYEDMDINSDGTCSGCGSGQFPLSHSHILSQYRHRKLKADPRNIVFDCMSFAGHEGCHDIWEGADHEKKMKLLNYQERMDYISEKDVERWNILKNREDEVLEKVEKTN